LFAVEELRALIDGALVVGENGPALVKPDAKMRAMILLGINVGFGNGDCATLMFTGTDLANGWINFPRPKTGIARRCPIWQETVAAIQTAVKVRAKPADYPDCGRVFLTTRGTAFVSYTPLATEDDKPNLAPTGGYRKDIIGIQFGKLLDGLGIHREGVGFYALRHTFETIAGNAKDQVAVDHVR
jgi:integrase